jgi:hypothetical protein
LNPATHLPKLTIIPQDVMIVPRLEGSFDPQTKLPLGKPIAFEEWFKPAAGQPPRWCRTIGMEELLEHEGRAGQPLLVVVTAQIDAAGRQTSYVIGSCSILLEDPFSLPVIGFRLIEIFQASTNVILAGWFWFWATRSLTSSRRGWWKVILIQLIFSLGVVLVLLSFIGPFDWETGTLIFTSDPGVYLSDLRLRGWGILTTTFLFASGCALMVRIIAPRKTNA